MIKINSSDSETFTNKCSDQEYLGRAPQDFNVYAVLDLLSPRSRP